MMHDQHCGQTVTICGSERFSDLITAVGRQEAAAGRTVLLPGCAAETAARSVSATRLGLLHRSKVRLADEVLVVSDGSGFLGEAREEVELARRLGKPVRYRVGAGSAAGL
jgi:hypothetical protein